MVATSVRKLFSHWRAFAFKPEKKMPRKSRQSSDLPTCCSSIGPIYILQGQLLTDSKRMALEFKRRIEMREPVLWHFNEGEVQALKGSSSRVMETVADSGHDLFQRVFKYDKDFKSHVKARRNYTDERVEELFRTHADRVLGLMHELIDNVNNVDFVFEMLEDLGRVHASFRVEELHIDLMLCNFLEVLQRFDWQFWTKDLETTWVKFLTLALAVILVGMRHDSFE